MNILYITEDVMICEKRSFTERFQPLPFTQ